MFPAILDAPSPWLINSAMGFSPTTTVTYSNSHQDFAEETISDWVSKPADIVDARNPAPAVENPWLNSRCFSNPSTPTINLAILIDNYH